jgi:hypothetical protein
MYTDEQDKKQRQNKAQGLYRKIKQQKRADKNDNKMGAVIVSICVLIMSLIFVMNALFDSGVRFAQFWGK